MTSSCRERWNLSEGLRKLKKGSKAYNQLLSKYCSHLLNCPNCSEFLRELAARSKPNPEYLPEEVHA